MLQIFFFENMGFSTGSLGSNKPGELELKSCRVIMWVLASILAGHLFVFAGSPSAQPRLELSPAQAQLQAAIDSLDAGGMREALRAGADPNYRYGGRGRSVLATAGTEHLLGVDERVT